MEKRGKAGKISWKTLIASFVCVHLAALLGSLATNADTQWYNSVKPAITPPSIVFPIVWSALFILISLSLYFAWTSSTGKAKLLVGWSFGINLALNALWSILFFGMQKPVAAFFDLILLWVTIVAMIFTAGRASRRAGWLLVPYLLWVSFAGVLNWLIAFG